MQENKQEKSQIKQNILSYLSQVGVSPYEFYKESGVTRGILQQNNGISEQNIARFLAYAPEVNTEWLLTGEGAMLKEDKVEDDYDLRPIAHPTEEYEGIPLIPLDAMAGIFTSEETILEYECERYIVPAFNGADFLINVKGTSMMPTYHSGDIVACKRVSLTDIFFQWGKAYVLDTDQGPLVKRIRQSKIKNHILLVSDNSEEYDPIDLHMRHVNGVALIIGTIRLE